MIILLASIVQPISSYNNRNNLKNLISQKNWETGGYRRSRSIPTGFRISANPHHPQLIEILINLHNIHTRLTSVDNTMLIWLICNRNQGNTFFQIILGINMLSDQNIAEQALRKAMKEFRCGNRQAARYWAHFAVSLAPRMEESWLILAEIAGPRASLEYFKEALRINPESQQARRGVYKIQQRLQKTNEVTSKRPPCPRSDKKDSSSPLRWFGMISAFVLAVVVVVNMYLFISQFEPVKAKGLSANERSVFALQPITTSTMTVTLQPTYTPTATSFPAILPIPNATATPIATPWPATAQTINSPSQPTPTIPSGEKRIIVNIADQHLYAYEGNALIYSFTISTGAEDSTQIGTFFILDKIPQAYSAPWGFWMPDWLGIYWVGDMENGIHALPVLPDGSIIWGDGLGTPISHGCVILNTEDARLLFNWADIGTEVNIIK